MSKVKTALVFLACMTALGWVFTWYSNPHFIRSMTNLVWACFGA